MLPSRQIEDQQVYTAYREDEPSLRFDVTATAEHFALAQALDKIGYAIIEIDGKFHEADADDIDSYDEDPLEATTYAEALRESFTQNGWKLSEPQQMIGGSIGSGFGMAEEQ